MGRYILSEGQEVYRYSSRQDSDLPLVHDVFSIGERLDQDYGMRLLLTMDDIPALRELLELDDVVTRRPGFKQMVEALVQHMEQDGSGSFEFESDA